MAFIVIICKYDTVLLRRGKETNSQNVFNFPSVEVASCTVLGLIHTYFQECRRWVWLKAQTPTYPLSPTHFPPSASKWRPLHPSSRRACMRYSGKIHLTRSPTAPRADRRRTQHPRGPPSLEIYRNLIPRRSRNGWRKLAESWATGGRSLLRTCHRIQPTR